MTFQFPQVGALADQIAQLQEQLDKLTTAYAPLRECEQQAAQLLEQVTNHAQLMCDKGIENQSLIDWANQIYFVITGVSTSTLHQISFESNQKDELTSCDIESNIPEENFIVGDIVQHVNGQVGTIIYIPEPFNGIVSVKMVNGNSNYHTTNLKLVSRPSQDSAVSSESNEEEKIVDPSSSLESTNLDSPSNSETLQPLTEAQAQNLGSEFIKSITSKADVDKVTWPTIKQVSQGDIRVLKEMALTARTKPQKQLIENIPDLLAVHIKLTGDSEDLNWVNSIIKTKAEELLEQKHSLQIDSILQITPEDSESNLQAVDF